MTHGYVIVTIDQHYIAIDKSSGGYPYKVDNPLLARIWQNNDTEIKRMIKYLVVFAREEWRIKKLTYNLQDVTFEKEISNEKLRIQALRGR